MSTLVIENPRSHGGSLQAYSACILIPDAENNHFMAVSRRDNTRAWGLPGGKADPGESLVETAVRETMEETGLSLPLGLLTHVFSGNVIGTDGKDYWVSTYLWTGPVPDIQALRPEAGLLIQWKSAQQLASTAHSPFAGYHERVFEAYEGVNPKACEDWASVAIRQRST